MPSITTQLMALLRSAVADTAVETDLLGSASREELQKLYALAQKHDVAHLLGAAVEKNQLALDGEVAAALQKKTFTAVYRYEGLRYELERVCSVLDSAMIPYLPLKGSVLRALYPEPWMRTSCDIDILVREEHLDAAIACITEQLGFTFGTRGAHDVSAFSPSGIHLELHFTLIESNVVGIADEPLVDVWERVKPVAGRSMHEMPDDLFYYYHVAHMAKHVMNGGCGVRPFLDLWILRHKVSFDDAKRASLLERGGLLRFARTAEQLCEVWLGGGEHTELTEQLEQYILFGGVYGNLSNRVSVQQSRSGGKFKYALSRVWLPYTTIAVYYPVLQKHKWLLPVCQVRRWFRLLFGGKLKKSVKELNVNQSTSSDEQARVSRFLQALDLK